MHRLPDVTNQLILGDCLTVLQTLPDACVQCVVTSPPYFGLRDYGHDGQIGLEETPDAYVEKLVTVFREVRRVLKDDGVLWLNLGDSYAAGGGFDKTSLAKLHNWNCEEGHTNGVKNGDGQRRAPTPEGMKAKNLLGIPWRVAFALQSDGWILRSDCIWHKPNCMPESVQDRPTKAHEYVFLLAKSERYYYDADAVKEDAATKPHAPGKRAHIAEGVQRINPSHGQDGALIEPNRIWANDGKRNCRTVWSISTVPYKGAHFAVMPQRLVEPCILAGSRPGDIVLDPFTGSGTVPYVAQLHNRHFIGIDLNAAYLELARERLHQPSLWLDVAEEVIDAQTA